MRAPAELLLTSSDAVLSTFSTCVASAIFPGPAHDAVEAALPDNTLSSVRCVSPQSPSSVLRSPLCPPPLALFEWYLSLSFFKDQIDLLVVCTWNFRYQRDNGVVSELPSTLLLVSCPFHKDKSQYRT